MTKLAQQLPPPRARNLQSSDILPRITPPASCTTRPPPTAIKQALQDNWPARCFAVTPGDAGPEPPSSTPSHSRPTHAAFTRLNFALLRHASDYRRPSPLHAREDSGPSTRASSHRACHSLAFRSLSEAQEAVVLRPRHAEIQRLIQRKCAAPSCSRRPSST